MKFKTHFEEVLQVFASHLDLETIDLKLVYEDGYYRVFNDELIRLLLLEAFRFNPKANLTTRPYMGRSLNCFEWKFDGQFDDDDQCPASELYEFMQRLVGGGHILVNYVVYKNSCDREDLYSYDFITGPDGNDYLVLTTDRGEIKYLGQFEFLSAQYNKDKSAISIDTDDGKKLWIVLNP